MEYTLFASVTTHYFEDFHCVKINAGPGYWYFMAEKYSTTSMYTYVLFTLILNEIDSSSGAIKMLVKSQNNDQPTILSTWLLQRLNPAAGCDNNATQ
jgi:hypothetical protein